MILYKYLRPDRLEVLASNEIRFTQPSAFNDPFDSQPCFERLLPRAVIEEVCGINEPPGDGETPEEREGRLKSLAANLELFGSQNSKDWYLANTVEKIAILSLAKNPDNILMWAHYADSHRGFVVGFEMDDKSIGPRVDEKRRDLREVTYSIDRPRQESPNECTARELFCTKSPDWTYEAEWRLFDAVNNADDSSGTDDCGNTVFLFRFEPCAISEVILGARMSDGRREKVSQVLSQPEYTNVRMMQSSLHKDQYRVEIAELTRS